MNYVEAKNLTKHYGKNIAAVKAVCGISLEIASGEFIGIMGESGSGKSTLLTMIGVMNVPTSGSLIINEIDVYGLKQEQRADFRREFLGFVFQSFHLIPYLNIIENVMLPLVTVSGSRKYKRELSEKALTHVGLNGKFDRLPNQISGGESERVAVARAIVNEPPILLADEPTGNLDTETTRELMELLQWLNSEGMTIIMVTHSTECAAYAHRIIHLSDGLLMQKKSLNSAVVQKKGNLYNM